MSAQCWKFIFNLFIVLNISNLNASKSDDLESRNLIKQYLQSKLNESNPYKDQVAYVRKSANLSDQEIDTIQKRLKVNNTALPNFLSYELPYSQNLRIGFCASGGGYRAAICTLGSLQGAQDIGLLDCVTYMSGLSGSTWTMAAWLSLNKSLSDLKLQFIDNMSDNIEITSQTGLIKIETDQFPTIIQKLITKSVFNQPLSSVDIWGALILDDLFGPNVERQSMKLSDQIAVVKDGNVPFPIYTGIQPISKLKYQWYEFSPYECGNIAENSYIPIWAFAREFNNGKSVDNAPEQNLSFLLGIFGSAYDVTPQELVEKCDIENQFKNFLKSKLFFLPTILVKKIIDIKEAISSLSRDSLLYQDYCKDRFLPAHVKNFNYQMEHAGEKHQKSMVLMDAGIDFNLPFPPLLRKDRELDVIIALDSSSDITGAPELISAQRYANNNGLKFPAVDIAGIEKSSLTVFGLDSYSDTPLIIYMPRVNAVATMTDSEIATLKDSVSEEYIPVIDKLRDFDPEDCTNNIFCSTYNFAYSKDEFDLLFGMTYINMIVNKDTIAEILKMALSRKYMGYFKMPSHQWVCR